jgi:serine protease Do
MFEAAPAATSPAIADDLADLAERLRRVTVEVRGRNGFGSGVIWHSRGLIVTSAHVARSPASVALADGRVFDAHLLRWDAERDVAALRIAAEDLPAAEVGESEALRVGEMVFAVGSPRGLAGALTAGIIHAIGVRSRAGDRGWIVADLRLAPGNSGGPLADARGRVVGINGMIHGGLALAVPSHAVMRFLGAP